MILKFAKYFSLFSRMRLTGRLIFLLASGLTASFYLTAPLWGKPPQAIYPRLNRVIAPGIQTVDTVKLLAIRVDFQIDDLPTTTGDGSFNSGFPDMLQFDRLPHNRTYFQYQLLFLKNFFEDQSQGKVFLDIADAVYPIAEDSAYHLSYPMWHYNYNDPDYLDWGLAMLFRDAWQAADTQNADIDFSQYDSVDCFIIFHAGVGKDFALDFDPTPFDIPSSYLELSDLDTLPECDPDYGIPLRDGDFFIQRGMILPESENQEGYELGMHGHMALLFGHHLGMPSLYNTETGASVIGWFGLMDQGSGKLDGLVPAPPCAWTKVKMGWVEPIMVSAFPGTITAPVGTIFKIPITEKEYFLVENIDSWVRPGVSWDSLQYSFYVASGGEYPSTFALLRDSVASVEIDPVSSVLTNIGNWGIGRPASGLLIWHIDENVIDTALTNNHININPEHLGVFLEEADGAQDIGQQYGWFSPGLGTELGSPFDAFFAGNEDHLAANPGNNVVTFSDYTFPDARSNTGAFSHLVFNNFSPIAETMTFTVSNDLLRPGFPKILPSITPSQVFSADITGDGLDELFAQTNFNIYGWNAQGVQLFKHDFAEPLSLLQAVSDFDEDGFEEIVVHNSDSLYILDFNPVDSTVTASSALIAGIAHNYSLFLISSDSLIYLANDTLFCWRVINDNPQIKWKIPVSATVISANLLSEGSLVALNSNFQLMCYSAEGQIAWTYSIVQWLAPEISCIRHVAGDIDRDGQIEIVLLVLVPGYLHIFILNPVYGTVENDEPIMMPLEHNSTMIGNPSLADIDDDGFLEIIFSTSSDGIFVIERNGVFSDYFPYNYPGFGSYAYPVLIADDNSGEYRLFLIENLPFSSTELLNCLDNSASSISGFPLAINYFNYPLDLQLFQFASDSVALAYSAGNYIYDYNTDASHILWGSPFGDKGNTALVDSLYPVLPQTGDLMPEDSVYNWPNPNNPGEDFTHIRYYLNYPAQIKIAIYDIAGDKVDELHDTGIAQAYTETIWDLTNISSGVYFARVEAKSGSQKAVKFVKIAVIK